MCTCLLRQVVALLLLVVALPLAAQVNDNCANALPIDIADGGYGTGTFSTAPVALNMATAQPGEYFSYAPLLAARSVWYRFSIPTSRRVTLQLTTNGIGNASDVGWTCYRVNDPSDCLPGYAQAQAAYFTPMQSTGSSIVNCLPPGEYLVQVTANSGVGSGTVTMNLTSERSLTSQPYDMMATALDHGVLPDRVWRNANLAINCYGIEGPEEICPTFPEYTQSAWITFTTPADLAWLLLYTAYNGVYGLYEGDIRSDPLSALTPLMSCEPGQGRYRFFTCEDIEPSTTYSIHVLFREGWSGSEQVRVIAKGSPLTNAPIPTTAEVDAPNRFGAITPGFVASTTNRSDALACNAYIADNLCGTLNSLQAQVTPTATDSFPLATYFTFSLTGNANIVLNATTSVTTNPAVRIRLFQGDVTADCASIDLVGDLVASSNSYLTYNCLPVGDYTVQITGAVDQRPSYFDNPAYNMLGYAFDLALTTTALPTTAFGLNASGQVEDINGGLDLLDRTPYLSTSDTFSCANSPLADTYTCNPLRNKVIHREFTIGDADGDGMPDSGMVVITGFSAQLYNNPPGWIFTPGMLFAGSADALATAEGAFAATDTYHGLVQATGCGLYQYHGRTSGPATRPYKGCHRAGAYTHMLFGDASMVGINNRPTYEFRIVDNQFSDPAAPEALGDLIDLGPNLNSQYDTYTCTDNAETIAGFAPCGPKAVYREFYLSQAAAVTINVENQYTNGGNTAGFRLFAGRASEGLSTLAANGVQDICTRSFNATECNPLAAGWYTIVTYGRGPNFDNNHAFFEANVNLYEYDADIDDQHRMLLAVDTNVTPGPLYNRPHKACVANNDDPIVLVNNGTPANPYYEQRFVLCTENFKIPHDTPIPFPFCAGVVRTAYYVFTLAQESYVRLESTTTLQHFLFPLDVRTDDSLLLATTAPLTTCSNYGNNIEVCRLGPGTYTVVYGATATPACFTFTPTLIVNNVQYSLHDFATTAYDFGVIPADGLFHDGAPGDVNTTYPGAAPSADVIYCTTGAFASDPYGTGGLGCNWPNNPNEVYPDTPDNVYYGANGTQGLPTRNLWYTFATSGAGTFTVEVGSPTMALAPGMRFPHFAVFLSDADGSIPYSDLVANGEADSTLAQGLTLLGTNEVYYCTYRNDLSRSYLDDICDTTVINRRFHVVIYGYYPNQMVDVRVRWVPFTETATPPLYDHYVDANVIGSGLVSGPYPVTPLEAGDVVSGGWDSFFCATVDAPDRHFGGLAACTQATLWYTFTVAQRTRVFAAWQNSDSIRYQILGAPDMTAHLFREIVPGDSSTSTGMSLISWAQYAQVAPGFSTYGNCLEPGTYHLMLRTCLSEDRRLWRPLLWVLSNPGDHCSTPHAGTGSGAGSYAVTGAVTCHSIGEAYGEDGSDMGCLPGPENWQSTWYRFNYTGTDTVDIAFAYTNSTNATQIARRVFYGSDCNAMTAGECNNNFVSVDVITCVTAATGSFFVQVLTPLGTTGNVTVTFNVTPNSNDDCQLFDPSPVNANFTFVKDCDSDTVRFYNASTTGPAYSYEWDFGSPGLGSTDLNADVLYPDPNGVRTYEVLLVVTHGPTNATDTSRQEVTIHYDRPTPDLGPDTTVCASLADPFILDATETDTTAFYSWQDGSSAATFAVSTSGTYWVDVTLGNCTVRDSIVVTITPRPVVDLGPDTTYCVSFSHLLDLSAAAPADMLWSDGAAGYTRSITTPGTYWVRATLGPCVATDTVLVQRYPTDTIIEPVTVCANACFMLPNGQEVCDTGDHSVTLVSAEGCDSTVLYRVTVAAPIVGTEQGVLCAGAGYLLPDGRVVDTPGEHTAVIPSASGCDSTITVQLVVRPPNGSSPNVAICAGASHTLPDGTTVNSAGTYTVVLFDRYGCDSTVTTQLTILQHSSSTVNASICAGEQYSLPNGTQVGMAGTYPVTLVNAVGCDSVVTTQLTILQHSSSTVMASICAGAQYTLPDGTQVGTGGSHAVTLVNAVGCDSIVTTQLTILQHSSSAVTASICAGAQYTLPDGTQVSTAGDHAVTLVNAVGCDSIVTTQLTILQHSSSTVRASICAGAQYTLPDGTQVSTAGNHPVTLVNAVGCDSVVTTQLTILQHSSSTVNASICAGERYSLPNGTQVSGAGSYPVTLVNAVGCDSVVTTQLTILQHSAREVVAAICAGEQYTLPDGSQVGAAGTYPVTLVNAVGCDSVVTTRLTILEHSSSAVSVAICAGEQHTLPDGTQAGAAGTYPVTLVNAVGCDSVVTTRLTILQHSSTAVSASICAGEVYSLPDGRDVSTGGTYPVTLVNAVGCDSVVTTQLTILQHSASAVNASICAGEVYALPDGTEVSAGGSYPVTLVNAVGCDSIVTTRLTILQHSELLLEVSICAGEEHTLPDGSRTGVAGDHPVLFVNAVGCDSTVTTRLTVLEHSAHQVAVDLCFGESYTLADGAAVDSSGTYVLVLENAVGCDSVLTTILTVRPQALSVRNDTVCEGHVHVLPDGRSVQEAGSYVSLLTDTHGCDSTVTTQLHVQRAFEGFRSDTICAGEEHLLPDGRRVRDAGTYLARLIGVARNGCDSLITVELRVEDPLAAFVFTRPTSDQVQRIRFQNASREAVEYLWDFGDGSSSTSFEPAHTFNALYGNSYVICLTAWSPAQCVDSICRTLELEHLQVHVPNSFTPNADGANDGFAPVFGGAPPTAYLFEIYDRWGQPLFSTQEPGTQWNGRFSNGEEVPMGVYVWKLTYSVGEPRQNNEHFGHVTLFR